MRRFAAAVALAGALAAGSVRAAGADVPASVTFSGDPAAAISSGVALPAGTALYWTSGTPPSAPLGDMKAQAENVLRKIGATLAAQGLSLHDVAYLRVYLRAGKTTGTVDYQGWFDAYGEFFGTAANATKPARSTIAVAGLVNPDWLIEVEAFAAYPKR